MNGVIRDARFGLKLLLREKGFSIAALLTIALCVGANTAIFTVVQSVVLRPLPYPEPQRLVAMYNTYPGVGVEKGSNSAPDFPDRRALKDVFEEVGMIDGAGYDVGGREAPERIDAAEVTPSVFPMLRIQPALGRTFTEEEGKPGNNKVVVLSHGFWRQRFNSDPRAVGQDLRLSGVPHRIVGVMPEGFQFFVRRAALWTPLAFTPRQLSDDGRHSNSWGMAGRLKPGVTVLRAQQRIDALNKSITDRAGQFKKLLEDAKFRTLVNGLQDEMTEDVRPTLYLLQAAVAFVLLIGCVNVANLMLVRSSVRLKELAVRFSLGASRWRLGRQLLTESLLLAAAGGGLGIAVGYAGVRLLRWLGAQDMPGGESIRMDLTVLGFTALVAIAAGLLFGIAPVFHVARRDLNDIMRQTQRTGTAERRAVGARSVMVVAQVALAFVLLIGAGLLTLSFARVLSVDPGFKPEGVVAARLSLPESRHPDKTIGVFQERLLERLRGLPGMRATGMTHYLPFSDSSNASVVEVVGYVRGPGENPPVPGFATVGGDYFRAIGIPLLQGRAFQDGDRFDAEKVVVIDEYLAKRYWPRGDAVGHKIKRGVDKDAPTCTIVGVVGKVKNRDLADRAEVGQVYFHYKQFPMRTTFVVARPANAGAPVGNALRAEVRALDPELPLYNIDSMERRIEGSLTTRRAAMVLCLIFGGLALLLSSIGIYGVLAYTVTQRTREFGIRMALGAELRDVLRMVFGHGVRLTAIGLALGALAAFFLARLMGSLLFDVKPADPMVFAGVALVLAVVAVLAALIPSVRAARIRPAIALRYE